MVGMEEAMSVHLSPESGWQCTLETIITMCGLLELFECLAAAADTGDTPVTKLITVHSA